MTDIHLLSGAYALDALDELERARFERHLASCAECRAEVSGFHEAAATLAAVTEVAPPPALRASVLAGISQVRPLPPEVPAVTPRRWFPLLVAAAVVILFGLGAAVWQPWSDGPVSEADRVLAAEDAQRVVVDLGERGRATVTRSESLRKAVIETEDMAPAPRGKVYELWLQSPEGEFAPAGLMPRGPDQTVVLEGDAARAAGVGITIEPAGGSPQPTSEPIALFDFSQAT